MQKTSFYILSGVVAAMWLSVWYFLSLVLNCPVPVTALVFVIITVPAYRYLVRHMASAIDNEPVKHKHWQFIILAAGLILITRATLYQLNIHGSRDALGMWNYYARFLSTSGWRNLFRVTGYYHPNHPPGLSSLLAFGWRISGQDSGMWPVALSFLSVLLIPVLIFIETWKQSIPLAIITLLLFSTSLSYVAYSYAQIADLPLAICFAGAFISMNAHKKSGNAAALFLCTTLLGAGLWIKNEGLLLAVVFCFFYARELTRKPVIRSAVVGIAPFLLLLLIYKLYYATPNDVFHGRLTELPGMLTNKSAYGKIFLYFREALHADFYVVQTGFILYVLLLLIRRKLPAKQMLCLSAGLLAMLSVYLITPTDLSWQLGTSLARILFELMPSFVYGLAMALPALAVPAKPVP